VAITKNKEHITEESTEECTVRSFITDLTLGVKQPGRETDYSPPSDAEVKE
jgi:hypothetical protein